jgi:hypothetical protein
MVKNMNISVPISSFRQISDEEAYEILLALTESVSHVLEGVILHLGSHANFGKILVVETAIGKSCLVYPFERAS